MLGNDPDYRYREMIDVTGTGQDNWVFDHVWPRLQVVLENVIEDVKERAPDVHVLAHASKRPQNRFGVSVDFYRDPASDRGNTTGIIVSCGTYISNARDASSNLFPSRITCRSELIEGERERARVIVRGPVFQFVLSDDDRVLHNLDQRVDATVEFINRNTDVIIVELTTDN